MLLWFIFFIIVYLIYYILIINNKKKILKYRYSKEVSYLVTKYQLNVEKIGLKKLAHFIALTNAFIISTTVSIVSYFDNIVIILIMSFVVLLLLIIISYAILGRILVKKYGK